MVSWKSREGRWEWWQRLTHFVTEKIEAQGSKVTTHSKSAAKSGTLQLQRPHCFHDIIRLMEETLRNVASLWIHWSVNLQNIKLCDGAEGWHLMRGEKPDYKGYKWGWRKRKESSGRWLYGKRGDSTFTGQQVEERCILATWWSRISNRYHGDRELGL